VEEREDGEEEETKKIRNERRQTEVKQINEIKKSKVIQAGGSKDAATNSIVVANVDKLIVVYSHHHVAADRIASAGISHQICVSAACTGESVSRRYEDFSAKADLPLRIRPRVCAQRVLSQSSATALIPAALIVLAK
jgi:hypothetical protein